MERDLRDKIQSLRHWPCPHSPSQHSHWMSGMCQMLFSAVDDMSVNKMFKSAFSFEAWRAFIWEPVAGEAGPSWVYGHSSDEQFICIAVSWSVSHVLGSVGDASHSY